MRSLRPPFLAFLSLLVCAGVQAQNLGFDLVGPPVDVKVERAGRTLTIAEVPSLKPGDRLWLHPDFPGSQSVHYLLVVAFLRGTTNPPPPEWFTKAETWDKAVQQEGIYVTVPKEAQQALIFLAPQATGDFSSLRTAVRGRPGAFVRSSQDLQQASFDRARIERYINEVKATSETNPGELQHRSAALAHSLKIKLDERCFDKPLEQQYSCLTHNPDHLILDDASSQSMLARVTNGATADLMNQISYSRLGGGGAYSAYIGAIIDFGRIMGSLHTAQYQYIPALAVPRGDSLSLRLNNPPSFRKPQSVLVVALPPVQSTQAPILRSLQSDEDYCLSDSSLVLPTESSPILFATQYAHDLSLRVRDAAGQIAEVPVSADPTRGGFVLDKPLESVDRLQSEFTGTIHGMWGFDPFEGPEFRLHVAKSEKWSILPSDRTALVVGRDDLLHVEGRNTSCVQEVRLVEPSGHSNPLHWKRSKPRTLEIKVPLGESEPGTVNISISQFGVVQPNVVTAQSYQEAAQFDGFEMNAGDGSGTLRGKRLDEVKYLDLHGIRFTANELTRHTDHDELTLKTTGSTDALRVGKESARVVLKDGRSFDLPASVSAPRPRVTLISRATQNDSDASRTIQLGSTDDLPSNGRIAFSLKSVAPDTFAHGEKIEVAAVDGSFRTVLSMSEGTLVLQDSRTAIGTIDPQRVFGQSAFGPLQLRAVSPDGTPGDWIPLGVLVRLPDLTQISCPRIRSAPCVLRGNNLFLIAVVSADPDFETSSAVPDGFTGQELQIARPTTGTIFLTLRDDPGVKNMANIPLNTDKPASRSDTRSAQSKKSE